MPSLLPAPMQAGAGSGAAGEHEISPLVQTAALAGFGLLYCGSGNRQIIEFLMSEISQPATTNRLDARESLCLTASWALGMTLLGRGSSANSGASGRMEADGVDDVIPEIGAAASMHGVADLKIEERLLLLLEGGVMPASATASGHSLGSSGLGRPGSQDSNSRCSRVMEGRLVNTTVTGPGAAVALGLLYLKSKNLAILRKLRPPQTTYALSNIQPDLILYRALASCLVAWEGPCGSGSGGAVDSMYDVSPTETWLSGCVPFAVRAVLFPGASGTSAGESQEEGASGGKAGSVLTKSAAIPLYLSVLAGSCLGLGMIYTGTGNGQARALLLKQLVYLQKVRDNKDGSIACTKELRPTVELALCCAALGLSITMAGTGDVDVLRVLRELRWKVEDSIYGTHMALGMSIGLLFLHGGQASLRRDNVAIGCLLMAVLPRFPFRTIDNQYHLQALRHLYVLSIEWRSLRIVDADTNESVNGADVEVVLRSGESYVCKSPCLLQELCTIKCIRLLQHVPSVGTGSGTSVSSLNKDYFPACLTIDACGDGSSSSGCTVEGVPLSGPSTVNVLPTLYIKRRLRPPPPSYPMVTSKAVLNAPLSANVTKQLRRERLLTRSDAVEIHMLHELYSRCRAVRDLVHQQSLSLLSPTASTAADCRDGANILCDDSLISLVNLYEPI